MEKVSLKTLIISLVFLLLNGCVSIKATNPLTQAARAEEGTVIATLTNNTANVNYWQSMALIRTSDASGAPLIKKEESYALNTDIEPGSSFTALYVGNIPAGTYRLSQIASTVGNMNYWVTFNDQQSTFIVRAQEVTDIGRLIVTDLKDNKVAMARSYTQTSNLDYLKKTNYDFFAKIQNQKINGWDAPPTDRDKNTELLSKYFSLGHFSPYSTSEGLMLVGSRMGSIWYNHLDKDGKWSLLNTNSLNAIFAIVQLDNHNLIVGGELGYLARFEKEKGFVEIDKSNLPEGSVVFLKQYQEHGLIVCISNKGILSFYHTNDINNPKWEAFGQAEAKFDFWSVGTTFSKIVSIGDNIVVAASPAILYVYYPETNEWVKRKLPKNVQSFSANFDKRLSLRGLPFPEDYYSDDLGVTWTEVKTLNDNLINFSDQKTGYMIAAGEGAGLFSPKPNRLVVTHDAGDSWETVHDSLGGENELYLSPDKKSIFIFNSYFLEESRDGGKYWYTRRSSVLPEKKKD